MAKILCVLYDDPIDGYPKSYPRDDLPKIDHYPGGQTLPTPNSIDFKPGALLGSVSGELGLRTYLESLGHTFIVTSDKEGPNSRFERELPDAEIVISQPFWPAYQSWNSRPLLQIGSHLFERNVCGCFAGSHSLLPLSMVTSQ
jgi:formate dehydrogenase